MSSSQSNFQADKNGLVTFVIATYNRKDDLKEAIDSILIQEYRPIEIIVISNSDDGTSDLFEEGNMFDQDCIRYYHFEERMGCPAARNIGYEKARGEFVITIDDDAVIRDSGAIQRVTELFQNNEQLGIIGFKGMTEAGETPQQWVPIRESGMADTAFEATHFIGFGNAIRADVFDAVGVYPENFDYSFEEKDLSLRALDAGFRIRYDPSIAVLHKVTASGRFPSQIITEQALENRIRVSMRNLPWRYVFMTLLYQSIQHARNSSVRDETLPALKSVVASWNELLKQRSVISKNTIKYIKSRKGPLRYFMFL
jgi:GT2 family glycosyltransferase